MYFKITKKLYVLTLIFVSFVLISCGSSDGSSDGSSVGDSDNDSDNDNGNNKVILSISAVTATVMEGDDLVFTVSIPSSTERPILFNYSVFGTGTDGAEAADFVNGGNGSGFIVAGTTATTITIFAVDDAIFEATETFTVRLSNSIFNTNVSVSSTSGSAEGTITDNDKVELSISPARAREGNSVLFDVSFTGPTTFTEIPIPFTYTVTGDSNTGANSAEAGDVATAVGSGFIAERASTGRITITTATDDILEGDETFTVTLTGSTTDNVTASASAIGTIINNNKVELSISPATASEGDDLVFAVSFAGPTTATEIPILFTYTAVGITAANFRDFATTTDGSGSIAAGTTSTTITITTVDDTIFEADETFTVTLTGSTTANVSVSSTSRSAIGTIIGEKDELLYDIASAEEFNNIRNNLAGTGYNDGTATVGCGTDVLPVACEGYELANDLTLTSSNFTPIGAVAVAGADAEAFTAIFDGNGFSISGLKIDRDSSNNVGLFAELAGATVRNLIIANPQVAGNSSVGALAGVATNNTNIENVGVLASIFNSLIRGDKSVVGGLVGSIDNSTISNSWASVSVRGGSSNVGGLVGDNNTSSTINNSWASGSVYGVGANVGGLVGDNTTTSSTISNSWASGSVAGTSFVGGLVGGIDLLSTISNSWASGSVASTIFVGGLVGVSFYNVGDSYWNTETSGQSDNDNPNGVTTAEIIESTGQAGDAAFANWGATDTSWDFGALTEYPTIIDNGAIADFQLVSQVAGQLRLIPAADTNGTGTVFLGDSNLQNEIDLTASDFTAGSILAIFDSNAHAENTNTRADFSDCKPALITVRVGNSLLTTAGVNGTLIAVTIAAGTTNPANWRVTTACEIELQPGAQPTAGEKLNLTVAIRKDVQSAIRVFNITFN